MPDSGSRWMFPSGGGSGRHLPRTWQPPLPPVPRTRSGGGRGSPRRSSRSGRRFRVQQPDAFSPRPGSRKDPSWRLKRWPEGRSDPFYVPLYSGSNACPGRLRPAPRLGKGDPLPPLALTRFLSRPRGGTELRWHPGLPEAHQPWPVSHIHRLSDSVPVTVQAPGRVSTSQRLPQGPRSGPVLLATCMGSRAGVGHPGSVAIGAGQSYLTRTLFLPCHPPDYLLIGCGCCVQLTSCAFSGSCWSGF